MPATENALWPARDNEVHREKEETNKASLQSSDLVAAIPVGAEEMFHINLFESITAFFCRLRAKKNLRQERRPGEWNHNSLLIVPIANTVRSVSFASETATEALGFTSSCATLSTNGFQNSSSPIGANVIVLSPNVNARVEPEDKDVEALIEVLKEVEADRAENGRYRQLLACTGDSAQGLLDVFQWLLDNDMAPTPEFRNYLIVTMQRLSKKTNLYPVNYRKDGITNAVEMPSDGGYANIYRAYLLGRP
ncbi:hypothetical protein H0H93_007888, partial [Arthromyces matolae]